MTVTGTFDVITDWEADVIPSPAGGLALALQWGPLAHAVSLGGWGRSRDPHLWGTDTWTHTCGSQTPGFLPPPRFSAPPDPCPCP